MHEQLRVCIHCDDTVKISVALEIEVNVVVPKLKINYNCKRYIVFQNWNYNCNPKVYGSKTGIEYKGYGSRATIRTVILMIIVSKLELEL